MTEKTDQTKVLLTDTKTLHKIKSMQLRKQMLPIAIVVLLLIANIVYPQRFYFYPTLAAFGWFLLARMMFRTKNKISAPEPGTFVSPVNGRVQLLQRREDATLITLRKSWLDVVELRLPYPDLKMDSNRNWSFETAAGKVEVSIDSKNITFFDNKNISGDVIGVIPSSAIISIKMPEGILVKVKENQPVLGGETVLFALSEHAFEQSESKSILVEEPTQDLN
ncbi:MAG: hypothetical protein R6V77_01175 [Candidatus Cloacimonadaceae bacterium]